MLHTPMPHGAQPHGVAGDWPPLQLQAFATAASTQAACASGGTTRHSSILHTRNTVCVHT